MIYWNLHAVDLLGRIPESRATQQEMLETLKTCFVKTQVSLDPSIVFAEDAILQKQQIGTSNCFDAGAFGGGPGQLPHAATTYAAILALCILSSLDSTALDFLEHIRPFLYVQFLAWKNQNNGAFHMHDDGEMDVRASYCVMSVAKLLNISTATLEAKVADYIASCQTYEGGFGGESFAEAHGGYTFCGVATLALLNQLGNIDLQGLAGWLVRRQMSYEGGFNGRANKLVDGCYSFWQGSALAVVSQALDNQVFDRDPWLDKKSPLKKETLLMDAPMLERYVLLCGQDVNGGLRDKPSKPRDFYHSCYCLSGLSIACHYGDEHYGSPDISIGRTHPLYNIDVKRVQFILDHFYSYRSDGSTC
jgi:protein farnesyltransferase subunit beta